MDMFQERTNVSNAWRGILDGVDLIRQGARMEIGDGKQTLFWHHNWALNKPLSHLATSTIPPSIIDYTVSDCWEENNGWKWELFSELLPEEALKSIAACEVTSSDEWKDKLIWDDSTHGGFLVKSALTIIRNEGSKTSASLWRKIWRLKTPQRMRFFIWLTTHDHLMTNAHRVKRGLASDPKCKSCLQEDEDTLHILRDCRYAREVWSKLVPASERDIFLTTPLYIWLETIWKNLRVQHGPYSSLLLCGGSGNGEMFAISKTLTSSRLILQSVSTRKQRKLLLLSTK